MANPTQPPFKVTAQQQIREPDEHGHMKTKWRVHFRTTSGTDAHVTVPDSDYTARNVGAQIMAKATEIEKVHALGQPTADGSK